MYFPYGQCIANYLEENRACYPAFIEMVIE